MLKIAYHTEPCNRCGGTGEYSWCEMHGSKCFKCRGSGKQLTREGHAAQRTINEFLAERFTRDVRDLTPGVQVRYRDRWYKLVELIPEDPMGACGLDRESGEWVPFLGMRFAFLTVNVAPDARIPTRPTPDEFRALVVPLARTLPGATVVES